MITSMDVNVSSKAPSSAGTLDLDLETLRGQFPILQSQVNGKPLVYLDNAATTQKPSLVIETLVRFYSEQNANIHRGIHYLSAQATDSYENARERVARFINAPHSRQVIFVRGATEGINLVAQSYGRSHFKKNDEIILTIHEHHSNIVPWQLICEQTGALIKVVPMDDRGVLDMEVYEKLLNDRTRLVAVSHISNAIGTINPVADIIAKAHAREVPVLVDGAQWVPHFPVDVQALDCDFYVFSGHKMYAPTGIGVLYGKEDLLNDMPPYHGGGDMIRSVTFEKTTYRDIPERFEAGTPNIVGVIGLAAAIDFLESVGPEKIAANEKELLDYATNTLESVESLRIIGDSPEKAGVVSFMLGDIHPHDIGTFLDNDGIAIRAGHHCAQPLMKRLGVSGTARASFGIYNTHEEVDKLAAGLRKITTFFAQ